MKSKVCILTTAHEAFDVRIFYKECRSLVEAGYEVYLVASHDKEETVEGVRIIPLNTGKNRIYRFFVKGWTALWKAIKLKAEVYHFHDPDLIPSGLILKLLGKKVIYDVHEDVPKDILCKEWIGNVGVRKTVSFLFSVFVKFSTLFIDRIIAATPSISRSFPETKTIVVGNVPNTTLIDKIKVETIMKTRTAVVYAGALTKIRGIREIIEAIGILDGLVELWLLGWWEDTEYEQECRSLKGWRHVRDFGVMSLEKTYSIMKQADTGIVNFFAIPNSIESLPNKAFEYLTCRLPMVMSEFAYWKDIFGKCAVFVNPMDPQDIAEKIKSLAENPEHRMKLILEGRRLIENEYSWESESKKLIELYKSLLNKHGGMLNETDNGTGK
jgi:glycosyltransferase involved in cell wall biosynthesis